VLLVFLSVDSSSRHCGFAWRLYSGFTNVFGCCSHLVDWCINWHDSENQNPPSLCLVDMQHEIREDYIV
jgi:hypothetical protein